MTPFMIIASVIGGGWVLTNAIKDIYYAPSSEIGKVVTNNSFAFALIAVAAAIIIISGRRG